MTLSPRRGFRSITDHESDKFDPESRAVVTMDTLHRMGHNGWAFHTSGKVTGMVDSNVDDFLLVTPAASNPESHIARLNFSFGRGDIDIVAYEGTTTSDDGTELTDVFNTNRNSINTPGMDIFTGPTVTDVGTLIHTAWVPPTSAGLFQSGAGALAGDTAGEEWILAPNTKYLIRLTNNSGATIDYTYELLFYEIDWTTVGN